MLRADVDALVVARGADEARLPFPWSVVGTAVSDGRALVVGQGEDGAHLLVLRIDGALPEVAASMHAPGARLGAAWLEGADAWVQLHGGTGWESPQGPAALPAGVGDLLVHVELSGATPASVTRLPEADLSLMPGTGAAWLRSGGAALRIAHVLLPDEGAAVVGPIGAVAPPRTGASLARLAPIGASMLLVWESDDRVELSVVGVDAFGAVSTRDYLPGGEGRVLGLDVADTNIVLRTEADGDVRRTALSLGADGRLRRDARSVDATAGAAPVVIPRAPTPPVTPSGPAGPLAAPPSPSERATTTVPAVAPTPSANSLPTASAPASSTVRVATMPSSGLVLGELPDRACTATPRPPPSSAPILGARVVVRDGTAWAIEPDSHALWRVGVEGTRALPLLADGLWVGEARVVALLDGGRRLGILDADGTGVARSVPIAGNVHAVVPTDAAAWVLTETGDGACGTELLRVPYDDGPVGVTDYAGTPGPMAAREDGVVFATHDVDAERSTLIGVTTTQARTLAWVDGVVAALRADRDGADLIWTRGGLGLSRLDAHAGAWTEARTVRIPTVTTVRGAWVDAAGAVVHHGVDGVAQVCRVDASGIGACVDVPGDADVVTARLGEDLLVQVGAGGLATIGEETDALAVARTDHASIGVAACRTGGSRRACAKALRGLPGETVLAVGQDGNLIASMSARGVVIRDARSGRVTVRQPWDD